jgi:guanylate kinase
LPDITPGLMVVLSSPSGAGKTTLTKALLQADAKFTLSVSYTTRPPRDGEMQGKDYRFVDADTFGALVAEDAFLEYATVFKHSYGTPAREVEQLLALGKNVLFDIDWQGMQQLKIKARKNMVSIFILPPSMTVLYERLQNRQTDSLETVQYRMDKALDEIGHAPEYDYIITNNDIGAAVADIQAIIRAECCRKSRQDGLPALMRSFREEMARLTP